MHGYFAARCLFQIFRLGVVSTLPAPTSHDLRLRWSVLALRVRFIGTRIGRCLRPESVSPPPLGQPHTFLDETPPFS